MVQAEIKSRDGKHGRLDDDLLFKGKFKCSVCGGTLSRFVWHSNTTHRKYVWHCTGRYMGKKAKCSSGNFSEEELKAIILAEINNLISLLTIRSFLSSLTRKPSTQQSSNRRPLSSQTSLHHFLAKSTACRQGTCERRRICHKSCQSLRRDTMRRELSTIR